MYKQDLSMAYFPHCSKKTASRLLARESTILKSESKVNSFTLPSRRIVCHANLTPDLLDALRPTGSAPLRNASPTSAKSHFSTLVIPLCIFYLLSILFLFTFFFI